MKAIWSGSLSFGLINIPVKLYSASKDRLFKFRLIDKKEHQPIQYLRVKKGTEEVIPYENIVRAYEYKRNQFVPLHEQELKRANPRKNSSLEIINFSDLKEIDPKYYEKPYYLEPAKKSGRAYSLLCAALKKSGKAAISRFVIKDKEHIAAIFAEGNILVLDQLRFETEITPPEGLDIPSEEYFSDEEMETALAIIKTMTKPHDPKKYHDTYAEKVEKLIESKLKGEKIEASKEEKAPEETDMKDLMKLLKQSLEHARK